VSDIGCVVAFSLKLDRLAIGIRIGDMRILRLLLLLAALVVAAGCASSSGSREYIPGKGWVTND
jgi:hypothetical protein